MVQKERLLKRAFISPSNSEAMCKKHKKHDFDLYSEWGRIFKEIKLKCKNKIM